MCIRDSLYGDDKGLKLLANGCQHFIFALFCTPCAARRQAIKAVTTGRYNRLCCNLRLSDVSRKGLYILPPSLFRQPDVIRMPYVLLSYFLGSPTLVETALSFTAEILYSSFFFYRNTTLSSSTHVDVSPTYLSVMWSQRTFFLTLST